MRTQTQLSLKQRKLVDALKSDEEKQEELNREMQQLQRSINKTEKKLNNTVRDTEHCCLHGRACSLTLT